MNNTAPENGQPLGVLDRLIVGMNALGSVWILMLILLVTTDAMSRSFFARPIAGVNEMVQVSIIGIVFMQLADAIRMGKLTRADSFLTLLRGWLPRASSALEGVFYLMGACYMGLGLWGSVPLLKEAIERKSFLGNEGVFTVIVWPIKLVLVVGLTVCLIQFLRLTWQAWCRAAGKAPVPRTDLESTSS